MRPALFPGIIILVVVLLLLVFAAAVHSRRAARSKQTHVALIGASIGQAWRLAGWPLRANAPGFTVESLAVWQFDKGEAVEAILLRPKRRFALSRAYLRSLIDPPRRPDIVILKECSSYFPGPLGDYQDQVRGWVEQFQRKQIRVAVATVAPVTRVRAARDPGKQESLLEYNAWLRRYAWEHSLGLVDLEAALREQSQEAYLRDEFAAADGSHLNVTAYRHLDRVLLDVLCGKTDAAPAFGGRASNSLAGVVSHADR